MQATLNSPRQNSRRLSTVGSIINAGDFTDAQLVKDFKWLREVKAAHGNMDSRDLKAMVPVKTIIKIGKK
jgi:predicted phosphodiesterase